MDEIRSHTASSAGARTHSRIPPSAIRPEILEVFRQAQHDGSDHMRQNYRDTFDRLIGILGRTPKMTIVSWCIASNLALLIGDRDPRGWRWGATTYVDPSLEKTVREFEEFEERFFNLTRKLFPVATQMQDCLPFEDGGLADLVKALQQFARPRARAADSRSDWHATAKLFAERIEAHFRTMKLDAPTRNSTRSPLLLAVQSLLDMLGLRAEADTIRKVLC